jgi:hypothetical protein
VVEVLLSDQRVGGTRAIQNPYVDNRAVHVLLEDERCGILVNRDLFLQRHKVEVARFEKLNEGRTSRICAVSWVMKVIGNGWGDLREPTEENGKATSELGGEMNEAILFDHARCLCPTSSKFPTLQTSTKQLRSSLCENRFLLSTAT